SELHVDHGADHAQDPPVVLLSTSAFRHRVAPRRVGYLSRQAPAMASAPPTISMISCVISDWRPWLATPVSTLINSSALSLAALIARRRAACSEAAASSIAL